MYSCGRCGGAVSKSTRRCPHCSALLAGIRCKGCGFVGTESDFPGDRCPKCGSVVYTGGGGSAPKEEKCKGCGKVIKSSDLTCPHCGYTQWGPIGLLLVLSIGCLVGAVFGYLRIQDETWHNVVGWGGGILGLLMLIMTITEIVKGVRSEKRYRR